MPNNLPESWLIKVWQHQLLDGARLITEEGKPIQVIYPGRINDDRGADFRDAVIAASGEPKKGDVEVDVRSSGWRSHRHHRDAVYNRVILHVVMWHNTKRVTSLPNGREVPILALHKYLMVPLSQLSSGACCPVSLDKPCLKAGQHLTEDAVVEFLDRAGEERFLAKVARFQADLAQMEAGQSLYQGMMGALGYSRNKLPFLELARSLPLKILESVAQGEVSDGECLVRQQSLLLGTAGLLPSQRQDKQRQNELDDRWVDQVEGLWISSYHAAAMSADAWHLFRVRPNNSPLRRLVAVSYLILRYREEGLLEGLVNLVKKVPVRWGFQALEQGLLVSADGYWASHFDFGSGSRRRSAALLGSGRAADMVVNVLLPFIFALGQFTCQPELRGKALDLYRSYPRLAANSVERQMMQQLGLSNCLVNSARRQQGLIHINNTLCSEGRCQRCCLSQLETGKDVHV